MAPKPKKRAFDGQPQAERLAKWLNQELHTPERQRVMRILYEIKDFLAVTKTARANGIVPSKDSFQNPLAVGGDVKEVTEELQERLQRYWRSTQLDVRWPPANRRAVADISLQIAWLKGSEVSEEETNAFLDVLSLTRSGSLHRLRECDNCPRWMFVKFPEGDRAQKHCSECRREMRILYQRDYQSQRRRDEKTADEKSKANVRRRK
jgi:hypothetical protein